MTVPRLMVPVLTLTQLDGAIDYGACAAYASRAADTWLDLFLISATVGRGMERSPSDRRKVLESWAGRVPAERLLACAWEPDDIRHAIECGVRPAVVLRSLETRDSLHNLLALLPSESFIYSHPRYTDVTFTAAIAEYARNADCLPAGGKVCKIGLEDVASLRAATGPSFDLYDGRCRHVFRSVQAGATGAVAVPLCILPADLPSRGDLVGVQHTIDRTQAEIDAAPSSMAQVALLTKALLAGALS